MDRVTRVEWVKSRTARKKSEYTGEKRREERDGYTRYRFWFGQPLECGGRGADGRTPCHAVYTYIHTYTLNAARRSRCTGPSAASSTFCARGRIILLFTPTCSSLEHEFSIAPQVNHEHSMTVIVFPLSPLASVTNHSMCERTFVNYCIRCLIDIVDKTIKKLAHTAYRNVLLNIIV